MASEQQLDVSQCAEMARACACFGLRKASRSVTQLYDRFLAPTGLRSTQLDVLLGAYVLGSSNLRELADDLAMDRSTLTRNLKPLISRGLLRTVPTYGRSKRIALTSRGERALVVAVPLLHQAQESLRERLGFDQLNRVLADLAMVNQAVRKSD